MVSTDNRRNRFQRVWELLTVVTGGIFLEMPKNRSAKCLVEEGFKDN